MERERVNEVGPAVLAEQCVVGASHHGGIKGEISNDGKDALVYLLTKATQAMERGETERPGSAALSVTGQVLKSDSKDTAVPQQESAIAVGMSVELSHALHAANRSNAAGGRLSGLFSCQPAEVPESL